MDVPDHVIPIPVLEQPFQMRNLMITAAVVVKGRLNVGALKDGLSSLVKEWPILTARVVLNKKVCLAVDECVGIN